jgi:carboxylesterase type B
MDVFRVKKFLVLLVFVSWYGASRKAEPVVRTALGRIQGQQSGSLNIYKSIPYAEPPVGRLRFMPTRPSQSWAPSVAGSIRFSPECLQSSLYSMENDMNDADESFSSPHRSEDCLYLNIWQPIRAYIDSDVDSLKQAKLPVMIWLHGGAFMHGSASKVEYEGSKLANRGTNGTIVVSVNYRLGALGFLVSTVDGLFGNYGLQDQRTAILWVKQHISAFGGDPNKITLFGESAGAMSVGLHFLDQQQRQTRVQRQGLQGAMKARKTNKKFLDPRESEQSQLQQKQQTMNNKDSSVAQDFNTSSLENGDLFQNVIMQSNPLGYK